VNADFQTGLEETTMIRNAVKLAALALGLGISASHAQTTPTDDCAAPASETIKAGCEVLTRAIEAFNNADPQAYAAVNHYPHIRITGPVTTIWETPEAYAASNSREDFLAKGENTRFKGWDRSEWGWRRIVQESPEAMHFAVSFDRLDKDNKLLASFESFYILTKRDDGWGIQARSSFAGIANRGAY